MVMSFVVFLQMLEDIGWTPPLCHINQLFLGHSIIQGVLQGEMNQFTWESILQIYILYHGDGNTVAKWKAQSMMLFPLTSPQNTDRLSRIIVSSLLVRGVTGTNA